MVMHVEIHLPLETDERDEGVLRDKLLAIQDYVVPNDCIADAAEASKAGALFEAGDAAGRAAGLQTRDLPPHRGRLGGPRLEAVCLGLLPGGAVGPGSTADDSSRGGDRAA